MDGSVSLAIRTHILHFEGFHWLEEHIVLRHVDVLSDRQSFTVALQLQHPQNIHRSLVFFVVSKDYFAMSYEVIVVTSLDESGYFIGGAQKRPVDNVMHHGSLHVINSVYVASTFSQKPEDLILVVLCGNVQSSIAFVCARVDVDHWFGACAVAYQQDHCAIGLLLTRNVKGVPALFVHNFPHFQFPRANYVGNCI